MQKLDLLGIYPALTCARHLGGGEAGKADALAARHIAVSNLRGKGGFGDGLMDGERGLAAGQHHAPSSTDPDTGKFVPGNICEM